MSHRSGMLAAMESMSVAQARRCALAAQGFGRPRPARAARIDRGHLRRLVDRLGVLQLDSVTAVVRSHYLPVFSRLGPYDRALLDGMAWHDAELFEYWGHEASLLPVRLWPLLRWRMAAHRASPGRRTTALLARRPGYLGQVLADIASRGPLPAAEVVGATATTGTWWSWSDAKVAVERLFAVGDLGAVRASGSFTRLYDLPERVLPATVLDAPEVSEDDARRGLLRGAAHALGVATRAQLLDYYRMRGPQAGAQVDELVDSHELLPVAVQGWRRPAYRWHAARTPRRVEARALLSPFDSLVFERGRTEGLFGFRYRLELYTPAAKRVYGYYVLPFLLGEQLVARVDVRADRAASVLRVPGAFAEDAAPEHTPDELAAELTLLAGWLGLAGVVVGERGDLAAALAARLRGQ